MSLRGRRVALGALAAVDLVALFYSGDAVYLWIIFFIAALVGLGALQAAWTLRAFALKVELPEGRLLSGETAEIGLKVKLDTILPPAHLAIRFSTADPREGDQIVNASPIPGRESGCTLVFECPFRGEYEIGVQQVEAVDLFGLVRLKRGGDKLIKGASGRLAVYPRTYPIGDEMLDLRMNEGIEDGERRDTEEVSSPADLRSYRDGDSLKRIHWKMSARLQQLIVREFDGSFDAKNMVFLDATQAGFKSEEPSPDELKKQKRRRRRKRDDTPDFSDKYKEENMTSCAASFCELFVGEGRRVRLVSYGDSRVDIDSVSGGFPALHLALARVKFGGELDASKALELECARTGAPDSLVFVTADLSPELVGTLCALGSRGARVTVAACCDERRPGLDAARDELNRHRVRLVMTGDLAMPEGGEADDE